MLQKILCAFFLFASGVQFLIAQKMSIDFRNLADQTESINQIQKLHFDSGSLIIDFKSGESQTTPLDQIQKIYFGEVVSTGKVSIKTLNIYPNPTTSTINVDGLPEGIYEISVFSVDGKRVIYKSISNTNSEINTEDLSCGIYFLSTNDGFNAKFVKL